MTGSENQGKVNKRRAFRVVFFLVVLVCIAGGVFLFKTGAILNKVTGGHANIFGSLVKSLPGSDKTLKGEEAGRINILLLGMRGEGMVGGGLLADTIMVLSIHPKVGEADQNKASLISVPRDLYVKDPGRNQQSKINAVFAYGEERSHNGGGMADMREVVGGVTGLDIPYAITMNFQGFKDVVNAVGGVTVHLDQPFEEGIQFRGLEQRCDALTYTIFSGNYEAKQIKRKSGAFTYQHWPLCFEKKTAAAVAELECGGDFKLPVGDNVLNGDKALCYARARYTSSDFERARRQQEIMKLVKDKALSLGTLTDFSKVSALLDSLGNNVSTNMAVWEMQRLFDLYQKAGANNDINQKVLEANDAGLLYNPPETKETGYILLPIGDNYDRIHELFKNSLTY